jgi:probable rRNA maturation factor
MKKPKIQVNLKTYQRRWQIDPAAIQRYVQKVWNTITGSIKISGSKQTEVSVVFLNQEQMQKYNNKYRKKNYPTDVLSFPADESRAGTPALRDDWYLGDILLCVDKASENAATAGSSIDRELQVLLLHGVLHLLGYDHETDHGEMDELERKLRKRLINNEQLLKRRSAVTQPS